MTNEIKKPPGYFKYILAIDSETTGMTFDTLDPSQGHQALSWGLIVADVETLEPIEKLYVEIKYNEESRAKRAADPEFGVYASSIHGLTMEYLDKHGISEEEACVAITNLIVKYWGPINKVSCLGHNVRSFDIPFLNSMLTRHDIFIPFNSRHCDSHAVGLITIGSFTSDALFKKLGTSTRTKHNALEDAELALEVCRNIRILWGEMVGINAYD